MNQLPPQDFDAKFCSTLNRKEMQAMNKMADIKKQACGKGKQIEIDGSERVVNFIFPVNDKFLVRLKRLEIPC